MRTPSVPILLAVTSTRLLTVTDAHLCAAGSGTGTAQEINGNWYCSDVKAITYDNFPGRGKYNKVTDMDAETGQCSSQSHPYSGSLSPLNEELSLHVRGPVLLKQVAVYSPDATTPSSKYMKRNPHKHSDAHAQYKKHGFPGHHWLQADRNGVEPRVEPDLGSHIRERALGDMVTATVDGKVVSWTNEYAGPDVATVVAVAGDANDSSPKDHEATATVGSAPTPELTADSASKVPSNGEGTESAGNEGATPSGSWVRQAYYHAETGAVEGITFLNHFGGVGGIPGTAAGGSAFGASLSYASSDAQSGAASPQVLSDALIKDGVEVVIMSNTTCDDGGCGYTRPGGVAYHGFFGDRKIFVLEFAMPFTGKTSFNGDMPAVWLHNAQIPLTSQYGTNPECSCWTSGCGEFDLFEILDPGNFRCKSTLHMAPAGGSSDWFMRPSNGTITAIVAFAGDTGKATIRVLDAGATFDSALSANVVNSWLDGESSTFTLSI